jgi:branched-chain amino acid transport system permease protein
MIVYSLLLVIVMIFKPSGLMGGYDFSLTGLLERIINGRAQHTEREEGSANEPG